METFHNVVKGTCYSYVPQSHPHLCLNYKDVQKITTKIYTVYYLSQMFKILI